MEERESHNFLIRGADYLARHADFKLVGRDRELRRLSRILMRSKANSVLLVGPGGVGCTALCLGLEAAKKEPNTPFDIVNKRLYWFDTDGLFSSGNTATMNENFQKTLRHLSRYPDSLLIIEDMRDFVEATRNNGLTHFINALMRQVDNRRFQAIFDREYGPRMISATIAARASALAGRRLQGHRAHRRRASHGPDRCPGRLRRGHGHPLGR